MTTAGNELNRCQWASYFNLPKADELRCVEMALFGIEPGSPDLNRLTTTAERPGTPQATPDIMQQIGHQHLPRVAMFRTLKC